MGGVTFFLFLVETVTGVLLMFYYRPTLEWAYNDILALRDVTSLGILRELHRWGAHAMVITVWLHMYRVFLTGSYKPPREFNWVIGVILLLLTLLLSFTGYLLPWDQLAIWAITVGSNMARATPFLGHEGPGHALLSIGGIDMITNASDARFGLLGARFVGEETLNRFYVLHCIAIPLAVAHADGDSLLAGAQRRRHQWTVVRVSRGACPALSRERLRDVSGLFIESFAVPIDGMIVMSFTSALSPPKAFLRISWSALPASWASYYLILAIMNAVMALHPVAAEARARQGAGLDLRGRFVRHSLAAGDERYTKG